MLEQIFNSVATAFHSLMQFECREDLLVIGKEPLKNNDLLNALIHHPRLNYEGRRDPELAEMIDYISVLIENFQREVKRVQAEFKALVKANNDSSASQNVAAESSRDPRTNQPFIGEEKENTSLFKYQNRSASFEVTRCFPICRLIGGFRDFLIHGVELKALTACIYSPGGPPVLSPLSLVSITILSVTFAIIGICCSSASNRRQVGSQPYHDLAEVCSFHSRYSAVWLVCCLKPTTVPCKLAE